jgi:Protein of unknown function (DUF2924)
MDEQIRETRKLIRRLPRAGRDELRKLWLENFGRPAATSLRRELMLPVLAYRIQERVYGGLDAESERRLREIIASQTQKPARQAEKGHPFKPGTRILREWKGQTHEVLITSLGFEYKGETFRTLSPIAKRITGTHWSGPAFFGTKRGIR